MRAYAGIQRGRYDGCPFFSAHGWHREYRGASYRWTHRPASTGKLALNTRTRTRTRSRTGTRNHGHSDL